MDKEEFIKGLKEAIETGETTSWGVDDDGNEYEFDTFDSDNALLNVLAFLKENKLITNVSGSI